MYTNKLIHVSLVVSIIWIAIKQSIYFPNEPDIIEAFLTYHVSS